MKCLPSISTGQNHVEDCKKFLLPIRLCVALDKDEPMITMLSLSDFNHSTHS